jgi:hypothetical protein
VLMVGRKKLRVNTSRMLNQAPGLASTKSPGCILNSTHDKVQAFRKIRGTNVFASHPISDASIHSVSNLSTCNTTCA